ncbi:MAG: insulinase family protein [Dehalococcoidales bacterium]|nr:insulinase family protein [Dehalococcoidales bacterium]
MNFFVGAGSRYETDEEAGISHFVEHLCFKGTEKRPTSVDICTVIEGVGGMLNAGTDKEMTVYYCKVAQPHFHDALDVMADILINSKFDAAEIEKERQVIVEEINMSLDFPAARVSLLVDELLWPGHALGRDIAGSRESVSTMTRDMMMAYLAERYQPDNVVLSIAGDIDEAEVAGTVNRMTAGWTGSRLRTSFDPYGGEGGRSVRIENRDTEQTQLCLALPGVGMNHPDRFKLDMLNVILGEGMSSRLFAEIRDNLGLAYSIHSYAEHFLDTGAMTVSAGVETKNLGTAVRAILEQMALLKDDVPEAELTKAKELFKGRMWLRMEDSRSVAGWAGAQEILTGKIQSVDEIIETVEAITTGELRDVASRLFTGDQLRLAVVGPVDPDAPLEDLLKL